MNTPSIQIRATCMIPMVNGSEISMSPTRAMSPAKISVGLFVRGENLDPDQLTARLGMSPTIKQTKGEARTAPDGRLVHAKGGLWARVIDADDVAEIDRLLVAVSSGSLATGRIANVTEAYFDVFIASESDEGRADLSFDIGAAALAAIAGSGLPLRMTFALMPR